MSRLDYIVFGATGYTGSFLVRELATTFKSEKYTWGVAGRSQKKLSDLIESLPLENKNVPTLIVDIDNAESIRSMCQNAKIIINCVGPYRFYGEQVVKECLAAGTHHLDVSGEPEYLESMQLKYNKEAQEKNVFIIGSCGFDSVPADMGVVFTQKIFKNELALIESYLTLETEGPLQINYATWESAVYGFAHAKNLGKIRKELFKTRLPKPEFKAPKRTNWFGYFYDDLLKKYCFNFMGSDKSVVQRTQYFNVEYLNQKSVQYLPYFTINSFRSTLLMILFGLNFALLASTKFGRRLLLKYHRFFSFGAVQKLEEPIKDMDKSRFKIQFRGLGFSNETSQSNGSTRKPDQSIVTEMIGPEPGYISTSRFIINCAITLLEETDSIPVKGGVLTPGSAFANTKLLDRLSNCDIKCVVIYNGPNNKSKVN